MSHRMTDSEVSFSGDNCYQKCRILNQHVGNEVRGAAPETTPPSRSEFHGCEREIGPHVTRARREQKPGVRNSKVTQIEIGRCSHSLHAIENEEERQVVDDSKRGS